MSSAARKRSNEEVAKLTLKEKDERSNIRQDDNKQNNVEANNVCEGNRIVNIATLAKNLKCHACKRTLSLENIVKEKRNGLHSTFTIQCETCPELTQVDTGKCHTVNMQVAECKQSIHADLNTKAVLATIHTGLFRKDLNKFLAGMNMPGMPESLYTEYEKEVGPAVISVAEKSEDSRIARELAQS